jgi:hypothetical protein
MKLFKIFILIVLTSFYYACNTLKPEKPVERYNNENAFKPTPSFINIPIELNIKNIETYINNKINGLIYNDDSFDNNGGDNIMVKAWKRDNISINLVGNQLSYRVPLKLWIKAGFKVTKLGITLSDYKEIEGEIALKFKTKFNVNKDWTISTNTTSDGYEWISKPILKVGPVDIPIKIIANAILNSKQNVLSTEIDKQVASNFNIKKYVQDAWNMMQEPINVSDSLQLWIKLTPQEISMTPLSGFAGKAKTNIGIKSIAETYMGSKPVQTINPMMPNLNILDKIDNNFQLNIFNNIKYSKIEEMAKKLVQGQTYKQGKYVVQVQNIQIYGSNEKLIIALDLLGSLKGKVYLTCVPFYNDSTMSIEMKDVDYELKTKNALIKSADWLYHGGFIRMLTPYLRYSIKDKINETKKLIEETLDNKKVTNNITLQGQINNLNIGGIYLTPDVLNVVILADGKLQLLINL